MSTIPSRANQSLLVNVANAPRQSSSLGKEMKPYSIIEDSPQRTTYEYKAIYVWALYIILGFVALGIIQKENIILIPSLALMVLYTIFVSSQYIQIGKTTKEAMKHGSVEMTGSKWSFKAPLRVTISITKT